MSITTYKLDQTHIGLRLTLLAIFFAGLVAGFFVSIPFVNNVLRVPTPFNVLAIPAVAAGIAMGLSSAAEKFLTPRWPSGRSLRVTDEGIILQERTGTTASITWDERISILAWHFVVRKRRAWVAKGWYCIACHLKQDDRMIIPYAFVSPEVAQALPQWRSFEELLPRKPSGKTHTEHPLSDIGNQAQLRYAEQDRWRLGAEMSPDDFTQLIAELQRRVPDWHQTG